MSVRPAEAAELDYLARVWYDGWQDAHAHIMPAELARIRTLESFRERLEAALPDVRVVGPFPTPVGFCLVKGDELYQLLSGEGGRAPRPPSWRRRSAAAAASDRLACVRSATERGFYEKCGWRRVGTVAYQPDAADGAALDVWRYETNAIVSCPSTMTGPGWPGMTIRYHASPTVPALIFLALLAILGRAGRAAVRDLSARADRRGQRPPPH